MSAPAQMGPRMSSTAARRWRRADTNVINVKFDQLKTPSHMHTGDVVHCKGCRAVLSKLSDIQPSPDKDTEQVMITTSLVWLFLPFCFILLQCQDVVLELDLVFRAEIDF